jgi:hypothetical protein
MYIFRYFFPNCSHCCPRLTLRFCYWTLVWLCCRGLLWLQRGAGGIVVPSSTGRVDPSSKALIGPSSMVQYWWVHYVIDLELMSAFLRGSLIICLCLLFVVFDQGNSTVASCIRRPSWSSSSSAIANSNIHFSHLSKDML